MADFQFFKIAAICHLRFVGCIFDHPQRVLGGLYHWAKFGWNPLSIFIISSLNISQFGREMHPQIGVFLGDLTP